MTFLATDPAVAPARPVTASRGTLALHRTAATLLAVDVLVQPVLAGRFLVGDVDAIAAHGVNGSLVVLLTTVTAGTGLLHVLAGHGLVRHLVAGPLLFLLCGAQLAVGYAGSIAVHVPLGVAVVSLVLLHLAWVWTRSAGRRRGVR